MELSRCDFNLKGKKAEKLVHDLALKTFLTDWCYLNPTLPNGKELCDFLVVYDEVAIIWQIKDLKLDRRGRYRSRDVEGNLHQLSGARRQLFTLKTPVEIENPRRGKELFNAAEIREIYLISVLLGEGEDIFSFVESIKNYTIHVFTRDFTQIILDELDTISDFTNYIRAKESITKQDKQIIILGGEEELLAFYLQNNKSFGRLNEATHVMIEQGLWERFQNSQEYRAKKDEDKISYIWDSIINRAHEGSVEYEKVARELARPNRFERRYLSKAYVDGQIRAESDTSYDVFRRTIAGSGVTYCFVFGDDPEPRGRRRNMLLNMCWIARGTFKENRKVIGIASEKQVRRMRSYDFCLIDLPEWTEENQKQMEKLQQETGILLSPEIGIAHEEEYTRSNKRINLFSSCLLAISTNPGRNEKISQILVDEIS